MNTVRLISLDLDGTFLDRSRKIPERNRQAVQNAREKGVTVVISTGSPYKLMPHKELENMGIPYVITANGSAIYEYPSGKCIYEESIDTDTIIPILEFLLTKDMHIDMFMGGKAYCPSNTRKIIGKLDAEQARKDYLLNNRIWLEEPISYIKEHKLTMQKITMNFYPNDLGEYVDRAAVKEFLEEHKNLKLATSGWNNLEITKSGVNKGRALKKICDMLDIPLESTMAFGDSLNDLDIVTMAGVGVAMDNAMEELKRSADEITVSNDECGVAETIMKYINQ